MSVLWETMSGLAPLIYTLPPNHVDEYEEDVPENHESIAIIGVNRHRLDSNARLALNTRRLDHYARFIKHVTIHNEDAYYATLHDLSIHKVSGYRLLPEVRTLNIHLDAVGGPEGIYMLLGPRVDAISVRVAKDDVGLRWTIVLFTKMFAICRNLQTLHVDFGDCHEDDICMILDTIRAARPSLTALHLGRKYWVYSRAMGSELIARLLRLISGTIRDFSSTLLINYVSVQSFSLFRNLQNLVIHLDENTTWYLTCPQAFCFSTLRSLEIITDFISKKTTLFIHRIRAEHLHTLAIFLMTSLVDGYWGRAQRDISTSRYRHVPSRRHFQSSPYTLATSPMTDGGHLTAS
ncbi:hypothetical protein POSPLADRAFT_1061582 [Postia placenta MAD-698-R-SB12]|uniref:Uncharacterized protein n=1 Tax=Postia placenta MAD-698-R-SB12 TaxID=670580 RepID=A0A1X6MMG7_9APHY|nr:hypothetical protein POSPLADRAFT_1061582 [Postia placenta MAD-698-R-SB12]OSX57372.1 hypothetical protein POSPLADRAFT_1061582 [Postia placenta MAD-698-R-SB12]